MPFLCSICSEESTRICARCTKDACDNHLCEKCRKCSDCCECEITLSTRAPESVRAVLHPETPPEPEPALEAAPEPVFEPAAETEAGPMEELPPEPAAELASDLPPDSTP